MNEHTNRIAAVAHWTTLDLEHVRGVGEPTHPVNRPGLNLFLHRRHEVGAGDPRTTAAGFILTPEHQGTHIDALCHQAEGLRLFGDIAVDASIQTPSGFTRLGAETIAPIVARGVLLDLVQKGRSLQDEAVMTSADLEAAQQREGVTVGSGDALLIRTGYGGLWSDAARYMRAAGMSADASLWVADRGVRVVGIDNMTWDVVAGPDPATGTTLPGHVILLVRRGIYIVENLFLEELAERRAYEFLFVCLPLKIRGGTGSPARPIALVPRLT